MKSAVYISGYAGAGQNGIARCKPDAQSMSLAEDFAFDGLECPSFVKLNAKGTVLYAVEETSPEGRLNALRVTDGGLEPMCSVSSGGAHPCHLCLSPDGKWLFAANYTGGSLAVCALDEDGAFAGTPALFGYSGKGVNPARQECPHIHFSCVRENELYVTDLGLDRVYVYDMRALPGKKLSAEARLPAGSGPRHLAFAPGLPEIMYVICELSNEIAVCRRNGNGFEVSQLISTLPRGADASGTAAAIRVSDGFVYAGNRGHDSVAMFSIGEGGALRLCHTAPCGGKTPRDIAVIGNMLFAANQDSDSITALEIDAEHERLGPPVRLGSFVKPSCIEV